MHRGLVYFCAWGNRCEAVHDAVDRANIEYHHGVITPDNIIMTTWHQDEPLEEASWFVRELASPVHNPAITSFDRFAVAVGNPAFAEKRVSVLRGKPNPRDQSQSGLQSC